MQELGLIGLRIQRMPSEPGLEFDIPSKYSYMTVCFTLFCQYYALISEKKIYSIMFLSFKTKFKVTVGNIRKSILWYIR